MRLLLGCGLAFLLSLSTNLSAASYKLQQIEPLNWWVGMSHSELQIMVHGEGISALEPELDYKGVKLIGVERTANPNYLFLNLVIDASTKPGKIPVRLKQGKYTLAKFDYSLEARRKDSAMRSSFTSKDAIYLITPDRFANGTAKNDSVPALLEKANRANSNGRHGGDIQGMLQHLDYVADLGFTMLWPTPLTENNQPEYSYHGYSLTDYYHIDSRFGSNEDFKNFVAAASKKGLGVIQDIVLNHIGSGHWWMKDLPAPDWLNFQTGFVPTNHLHTTAMDIHAASTDHKLFTDGWFVESMPDLNQRNSLLAKYLMQNSVWWIEYANLSGVREDTYSYSDANFLAAWGKYILEEYPHFNMVGEEMNSNPQILSYWQQGNHNRDGYESSLPSLMDFPVVFLMPSVLNAEESRSQGFVKLYEMLANDFVYADPMKLVVFPDNHDTSRIYSLLYENLNLLKTSMIFTATTRGIPQFYYGSEVLAKSPIEREDGLVRSDMPGGWAGDYINAFTGKGLSADQADAQRTLKTLLRWRKTNAAVQTGKLVHFVPEAGTYVYFRYTDTQKVMVVLNKNKQDTDLDLKRFGELLNGEGVGKNILTGESIDLSRPLKLKAMTSVVIDI